MADRKKTREGSSLPGLALLMLFLTGLVSLALAGFAAYQNSLTAAGVLLLAGAISFGVIVNVSFR